MRVKLIERLAYRWRKAENKFLETESDKQKFKVLAYQRSLNLTKEESKELDATLKSVKLKKGRG